MLIRFEILHSFLFWKLINESLSMIIFTFSNYFLFFCKIKLIFFNVFIIDIGIKKKNQKIEINTTQINNNHIF